MPDLIDAIDERIAAKTGDVLVEGIIVSVAPRYIRIKLTGSSRTVTAFYDSGMSLEAGKRAFITWSKQQARYVVLASIDAPGSQSATSNRNPADFQLAPPSNVAAVALPKAILVKWDDPIVQVLAYEIQSNSSATDVGATTELVTRGTFLKSATVQTYFRVRSITTDYRYSSWSAWVNATPQTIYTTFVSLTDVNIPTPSDGDIPMWDAATSKWIAGMAGMFSGTATDVPYTPTDPSDWSGPPTNVGEALDELAATGGGGGGSLTVKEVDGTPSVTNVNEIRVANNLLTDVGGGVVSIARSRRDLYNEPDGSLMGLTPNYWQEFDGSSLPGDWSVTSGPFATGPTADAGRSCVEIEATSGNAESTGANYVHTLSSPISGNFEFETKIWGDFYSSTGTSNGINVGLLDSASVLIVNTYFYNVSAAYYHQSYSVITGTSYSTGNAQQLPLFMVRALPFYVRYTRYSNTLSTYWSADGENWVFMASKASVTNTVDKLWFHPYRQVATIPTKARIFYARINS